MEKYSMEDWEAVLKRRPKHNTCIGWRMFVQQRFIYCKPESVSLGEFWYRELKATRPDLARKIDNHPSCDIRKLSITNRFWDYISDSWDAYPV